MASMKLSLLQLKWKIVSFDLKYVFLFILLTITEVLKVSRQRLNLF